MENERAYIEGVAQYIRPLAICIFRRPDGALLLAPGYDHVKGQRFYRPLGGGIEFGEMAEDTAKREILEELGADIEVRGLMGIFENIFTYRGQPGHELVWVYEATLLDPTMYDRDILTANESGSSFEVHWVQPDEIKSGDAPLYPDGLRDLLFPANATIRS